MSLLIMSLLDSA